jgi:hypothetical protein
VLSREESGNRGKSGENRSVQGHPRNPCFAAVFGFVMDLFLQMLEGDLHFFQRRILELRSIQAGIDKWHDSSLIQRRNSDEPNCNVTAGLSDLQKTKIT